MAPVSASNTGNPTPVGNSTNSSFDKPPQSLLLLAAAGGFIVGLVGAQVGTVIG